MKNFLFILLGILCGIMITANADYFDNSTSTFTNGECIGGACPIESLKTNYSNTNNNDNPLKQDGDYVQIPNGLQKKDNLFIYDANCQFGQCLPQPTGSYKP